MFLGMCQETKVLELSLAVQPGSIVQASLKNRHLIGVLKYPVLSSLKTSDSRHSNNITVEEHYCIPDLDDILSKVANSQVLSKLDLTEGFH